MCTRLKIVLFCKISWQILFPPNFEFGNRVHTWKHPYIFKITTWFQSRWDENFPLGSVCRKMYVYRYFRYFCGLRLPEGIKLIYLSDRTTISFTSTPPYVKKNTSSSVGRSRLKCLVRLDKSLVEKKRKLRALKDQNWRQIYLHNFCNKRNWCSAFGPLFSSYAIWAEETNFIFDGEQRVSVDMHSHE